LVARLSAPLPGAQCIYYRYLLERQETDSDGDTHWRTVTDSSQVTDFYLRDETGTARINALASEAGSRWSVKQKYVSAVDGYRHTEWRIDPQGPLIIFGWRAPIRRHPPWTSPRQASTNRLFLASQRAPSVLT
jgi:hypothetical protein